MVRGGAGASNTDRAPLIAHAYQPAASRFSQRPVASINILAGIIKRGCLTTPHLTGMKRKTANIGSRVEPRLVKAHSESVIRTGKLVVNLDTRVATVDSRPLRLTAKEYGILELLSLRKGTTLSKEMFLNHLYGGMDEPELKIIDVFVCKLRKKLAQATGGHHYIQTIWGRGHVLRDPAPEPAATPVVTLEGLGGRHDEAGTRAADDRTVAPTHPPSPQTASPLGQIERRLARCRDDVRNHPVGRRRAPVIGHRAEVRRVSSPVEIRYEDAVTKDGGPLHLPRPDPLRSLFGCATARCHE
jgi:DNA-binding winged helix-turn-helix (wHTH) protein